MRDVLARAWPEYYRRWQRYALSLSRDPDKAEEIVQEAVARTIQASPTFDEPVDAHHYIRRAIRTTAVATWKKASRQYELDEELPATAAGPLQGMLLRHAGRVDRRMAKRLVVAIDALPEQNRRAIRMKYLLRPPLKLRQIAEIEGRAISTIHDRIERGKRFIAARLREDEDAPER